MTSKCIAADSSMFLIEFSEYKIKEIEKIKSIVKDLQY